MGGELPGRPEADDDGPPADCGASDVRGDAGHDCGASRTAREADRGDPECPDAEAIYLQAMRGWALSVGIVGGCSLS